MTGLAPDYVVADKLVAASIMLCYGRLSWRN